MSLTQYTISVDQLVKGLFIIVDKDKCPFRKNSFKIKSDKQIAKILQAGVTHVNFVFEKSDRPPLDPKDKPDSGRGGAGRGAASGGGKPAGGAGAAPAKDQPKTPVSFELLGLKKETVEKNKERRKTFAKCEKRYDQTITRVGSLLNRVSGRSGEAAAEASKVVDALVETFLSDRDTVVSLMNSKSGEPQKNYHALNVTVLAMLLGRVLKMKSEAMRVLGMGAMFHDIGKGRIPIQSLGKSGPMSMNKAAEKYLKEHPVIGTRLVSDIADFPKIAARIILEHHERVDGAGYPKRLKGDAITPFARIVSITNAYDNLVNKPGEVRPMTPHEALKHMYATQRKALDPKFLGVFIRTMGVYPAGTCVELSNGQMGMVVTTNPKNAARPVVLMYHPEVPKREALMVDLVVEDSLEIVRALRPEELSREVFYYLSPSNNINYYADTVPKDGS